jgi:hypothetical protein
MYKRHTLQRGSNGAETDRQALHRDEEYGPDEDDEDDEHEASGSSTTTTTCTTTTSTSTVAADEPTTTSTSTSDAASASSSDSSPPSTSSSSASASPSSSTAVVHDIVIEHYSSIAELEALGPDTLRHALKVRDLPCGGSTAQRAERLFLIRGQDPSKWKALTKPKAKRSKKAKPAV